MSKILIPYGSGHFKVQDLIIHRLSQTELHDFISHGSVMGYLFERLIASEYSNITTVRILNQKKDLVIEDPNNPRASQHWEAKGFSSSAADCANKTIIQARQLKCKLGASSEVGAGRKADIEKSKEKYKSVNGYIFHLPGTFPEIYHYQLPIEEVARHRDFGTEISFSSLLDTLRKAGHRPVFPTRIRNIPIHYSSP